MIVAKVKSQMWKVLNSLGDPELYPYPVKKMQLVTNVFQPFLKRVEI